MREAPAPLAVHKFGGAALTDASAIRRVVALLAEGASGGRVVVTSALSGVTDALLAAATVAATGDAHGAADDARRLRERHHDVARALLEGDARDAARAAIDASYDALDLLLAGVSEARHVDARTTDLVLSRGERLAAMLVCGALASVGVPARVMDATRVLHTDGALRRRLARPGPHRSGRARARSSPRSTAATRSRVPGFLGAGADGSADDDVVTLGRGGSDLTATLLARALRAPPGHALEGRARASSPPTRALVPDARVIPQLHAREAAELAYYGAKVLHPRALIPLLDRAHHRCCVRPFADPAAPGTEIVARARRHGRSPVKALSAIGGQALVTVDRQRHARRARHRGAHLRARCSARGISRVAHLAGVVGALDLLHRAGGARRPTPRRPARGVRRRARARRDRRASRCELGHGHAGRRRARAWRGTPGIAARVFGALADARHEHRRDRAGLVGAQHLASSSRARRRRRAAAHPRRVPAEHDRRRRASTAPSTSTSCCSASASIGRELARHARAQLRRARARRAARRRRHRSQRLRVRRRRAVARGGWRRSRRTRQARPLAGRRRRRRRGRPPPTRWQHIATHALSRPILVDLTADDTRPRCSTRLAHGMDLVLANKRPLAGAARAARERCSATARAQRPARAARGHRRRRAADHRHRGQAGRERRPRAAASRAARRARWASC